MKQTLFTQAIAKLQDAIRLVHNKHYVNIESCAHGFKITDENGENSLEFIQSHNRVIKTTKHGYMFKSTTGEQCTIELLVRG